MFSEKFQILRSAKFILLILFFSAFQQMNAQKAETEDPTKVKSKGFQKTANPYIHYVYINGFKNYTVEKLEGKETGFHELRFHHVVSAMYTRQLMFDNFGKWQNEIEILGTEPMLVWRDIKLLKNSKETFTVFAGGISEWKEKYASISVFDSKRNDCLAENHPLRKQLIQFFSEKIWNLADAKAFEKALHERNSKDLKNK